MTIVAKPGKPSPCLPVCHDQAGDFQVFTHWSTGRKNHGDTGMNTTGTTPGLSFIPEYANLLFSGMKTKIKPIFVGNRIIMSESLSAFPMLFGLIAATIHVLSGPDHLAAVGPLALNTRFRPWVIGMSWGIGHLVGMLLLGMLFIYFKEFIPFDYISKNSEKLVGILLILIGMWAFFRMYLFNRKAKHTHIHKHKDESGHSFVHFHSHDHSYSREHEHDHEFAEKTYLAAMGIGIIHGLAGFSHILSILPTLAFPNRYQSVLYLTGFGIGTIVSMVVFSFILGWVGKYSSQKKKDTVFLIVNGIAGTAVVFVGIFWLWSNY